MNNYDINALVFKVYDKVYKLLIIFISTFLMKYRLMLRGVKFSKGIRFFGFITIYRAPLSHINIGENVEFRSIVDSNLIGINRRCIISTHCNDSKLNIGRNCGLSGTVIGAFSRIEIGDNVKCGANTLITDSDWHLDDKRSGIPKPIFIGNNVWLGVNSVVLKGVKIGENSIIGANSVVTKDIPSNVIAAGNPCKVIKAINNEK
jgi:acetyltransferase-like isoleucine patch superfamily enzyme